MNIVFLYGLCFLCMKRNKILQIYFLFKTVQMNITVCTYNNQYTGDTVFISPKVASPVHITKVIMTHIIFWAADSLLSAKDVDTGYVVFSLYQFEYRWTLLGTQASSSWSVQSVIRNFLLNLIRQYGFFKPSVMQYSCKCF